MARDHILHRIRTGLGRSAGEAPPPPPPVRLRIPEVPMDERIATMRMRIETLAGKTALTTDPLSAVREVLAGRTAVASNSPYLAQIGVTGLPGVRSGILDREELTAVCATAEVGITSADYALADTGTLVMIASPEEQRLISLLPPAHLAVVPQDRILTGLDELFTRVPLPADISSSLVLITGPSRTADIEQILVRGVHGPGQLTVVIVG